MNAIRSLQSDFLSYRGVGIVWEIDRTWVCTGATEVRDGVYRRCRHSSTQFPIKRKYLLREKANHSTVL